MPWKVELVGTPGLTHLGGASRCLSAPSVYPPLASTSLLLPLFCSSFPNLHIPSVLLLTCHPIVHLATASLSHLLLHYCCLVSLCTFLLMRPPVHCFFVLPLPFCFALAPLFASLLSTCPLLHAVFFCLPSFSWCVHLVCLWFSRCWWNFAETGVSKLFWCDSQYTKSSPLNAFVALCRQAHPGLAQERWLSKVLQNNGLSEFYVGLSDV